MVQRYVATQAERLRYGKRDNTLHTQLSPYEVAVAYNLARSLKLLPHDRFNNASSALSPDYTPIAERVNKHRSSQGSPLITPATVQSLLRHLQEKKLTVEDFLD